MKKATLVFPVRTYRGRVETILLGEKKRGFGKGKWNGFGGKVERGEVTVDAAVRELKEECGLLAKIEDLRYVADIMFKFPKKPEWNMRVHAFIVSKFGGTVEESDEMKPMWWARENIPYSLMWPDDRFWMPVVLPLNTFVLGTFTFNDDNRTLSDLDMAFWPGKKPGEH